MTKHWSRLGSVVLVGSMALLFGPIHSKAQERGQRGGGDASLVNVPLMVEQHRLPARVGREVEVPLRRRSND